MFGRKKKRPLGVSFPLHFKDAAAAVEYASAYLTCKLIPGAGLPAVVLDAAKGIGVRQAVQVKADGNQFARLKVCGEGGGFEAMAETAGPKGPALKPGDLVLWQAFEYIPAVGNLTPDKRTGWAGLIVAVLAPTFANRRWTVTATFG